MGKIIILSEQVIQRSILDYLGTRKDLYFFRSGTGVIRLPGGRVFKSGRPGCPDISVIHEGKYIGLEVKKPGGRQSKAQKIAEQEILAAGGQYHIVKSVAEVRGLL